MILYFLSSTPCALTVDGTFAGMIDGVAQRLTLDTPSAFMTVSPTDDTQPHNFLFDEHFLRRPPAFADVYLYRDEATISFHSFVRKNRPLCVLLQTKFEGTLATVFSQGAVTLSLEGRDCRLYDLPDDFHTVRAERITVGGRPVLLLVTDKHTAVVSAEGKLICLREAPPPVGGQTMTMVVPCHTCTDAVRYETYDRRGDEWTLIESRTEERVVPDDAVLHFAFLQGLLTGCDVTHYLAPDLQPRLSDLKTFLGDFKQVLLPTESVQTAHEGQRLVGLAYDGGYPNRFLLRYFVLSVTDGKVDNLSPLA